ncbi:MAG: helix-turn-helix domain-containing protein [Rikenellaceae bacterium]
MPTRTTYITGHTSEFDQFREGVPVHLEAGGFLLCTSGSSDVVVDTRQYTIKQWDLVVAFPLSYAHAIHTSDDFEGVIFGIDTDILISTELSNKSFYINSITDNPCISLRLDEVEKVLSMRDIFLRESAKKEHPLRNEIDEAALKIIIYEVAALFVSSQPNVDHKRSRDDIIFSNFVIQLHSEVSRRRDLEYYAQMQSITPSHLSKVVKRVSHRPASEWISLYTVACIKRLLQNKSLSIATIADRLEFPNASFLSQYFKKMTSKTPKQYRTEFFRGH